MHYGKQAQTEEKEDLFKTYRKNNKQLNPLIDKKFQKLVTNKKRWKIEKEPQHFQEMQISDNKDEKSVSSLVESMERGEILSSNSK